MEVLTVEQIGFIIEGQRLHLPMPLGAVTVHFPMNSGEWATIIFTTDPDDQVAVEDWLAMEEITGWSRLTELDEIF